MSADVLLFLVLGFLQYFVAVGIAATTQQCKIFTPPLQNFTIEENTHGTIEFNITLINCKNITEAIPTTKSNDIVDGRGGEKKDDDSVITLSRKHDDTFDDQCVIFLTGDVKGGDDVTPQCSCDRREMGGKRAMLMCVLDKKMGEEDGGQWRLWGGGSTSGLDTTFIVTVTYDRKRIAFIIGSSVAAGFIIVVVVVFVIIIKYKALPWTQQRQEDAHIYLEISNNPENRTVGRLRAMLESCCHRGSRNTGDSSSQRSATTLPSVYPNQDSQTSGSRSNILSSETPAPGANSRPSIESAFSANLQSSRDSENTLQVHQEVSSNPSGEGAYTSLSTPHNAPGASLSGDRGGTTDSSYSSLNPQTAASTTAQALTSTYTSLRFSISPTGEVSTYATVPKIVVTSDVSGRSNCLPTSSAAINQSTGAEDLPTDYLHPIAPPIYTRSQSDTSFKAKMSAKPTTLKKSRSAGKVEDFKASQSQSDSGTFFQPFEISPAKWPMLRGPTKPSSTIKTKTAKETILEESLSGCSSQEVNQLSGQLEETTFLKQEVENQ